MKILIIKLSSLGDIIHALPVLTQLKKLIPTASISWLVLESFTELLQDHPQIDELFSLSKDPFCWPTLIKDLRSKNFDFVLDLQGLMKSGLIASLTGAKEVVGLSPARERLAELFWRRKIQTSEILNPKVHIIDRSLEILKVFSLQASPFTDTKLNFNLPVLESLPASLQNTKFIVCAPQSRWESKNWPTANWQNLLEKLLQMAEYKIVLLGSEKDDTFGFSENSFLDLRGQTSLNELKSILPHASLVVGSDSGLLHLAGAYGCNTLGLYGPTSPERSGPWKGNYLWRGLACSPCHKRQCPLSGEAEMKCLKDLSPENVFEKAKELLR